MHRSSGDQSSRGSSLVGGHIPNKGKDGVSIHISLYCLASVTPPI